MVDAKALFNSKIAWFTGELKRNTGITVEPDTAILISAHIYSACIISEAITNAKDEIIQKLEALEKAVKVE